MSVLFWRDVSYSSGTSVIVLSLMQLFGWLHITDSMNGPVVLVMMLSETAGTFLSTLCEYFGLAFSAQALCQVSAAAALGTTLSAWWTGAELTPELIFAICAVAVCAFAVAASMNKLAAGAAAEAINSGIAARSRAMNQKDGASGEGEYRSPGADHGSTEDGTDNTG